MKKLISLRQDVWQTSLYWITSLYIRQYQTINLSGDDYRTVLWNAVMGYVDVDEAIEDLNTRYNDAYDSDIASGSIKRLVIEDFDALHPNDGTVTYLDE